MTGKRKRVMIFMIISVGFFPVLNIASKLLSNHTIAYHDFTTSASSMIKLFRPGTH